MNHAEAHLLSPYRPPTSYPVTLNPDEASAWLAGYFALWHPAVISRLARPPQVSSTYDHDQPGAGFYYVVPQGPHLFQPDDWPARVEVAQAFATHATTDLTETRSLVLVALQKLDPAATVEYPEAIIQGLAALGYGYLVVEGLYDAADHQHLLDGEGFWADLQAAIREPDQHRQHFTSAGAKLQVARETLNTNSFHLLDWAMLNAEKLDAPWPASLARNLPLTVIGSGELFRRLPAERLAELQAKTPAGLPTNLDIACGAETERDDSYLPAESQWWNLTTARKTIQELFGVATNLHARQRSAFHPLCPSWWQHAGFTKGVMVSLDGALTPNRNACVLNWPAPDGKSIDALGREPQSASDPQTFFNLVYTLHTAMTQDSRPTAIFAHKGEPAAIGYAELLTLTEYSTALGEFTSTMRYLEENHYGDYLGTVTGDDFFADALDHRVTTAKTPWPVGGFARHLRLRRRFDAAQSLVALHRMLTPPTAEDLALQANLVTLESGIETEAIDTPMSDTALSLIESQVTVKLAERLQARSADNTPGYLLFNPCAFTRRAAVEITDFGGPVAVTDPIKAAQFDGASAKLVVEIPALGFAWIPKPSASVAPPKPRIKTAEGMIVRNEFFEAEIDPNSGGLRAFRDLRTRINRLGMLPVFNPGSKSRATNVAITSSGTALGEITVEGEIVDEHFAVLAKFRHRLRAWMGRPALEMLLEIDPIHNPTGYPWHAYFGARFGCRDDRAAIFRGLQGMNQQSTYSRPVSPDYLEFRLGSERTFLFTGGLPFAQKQGGKLMDIVLIPEGEQTRRFEFLLACDRDYPMQNAQGWTTPTPLLATTKGPPNGMASSWLAYLDLPSVLMTSFTPTTGRAITARMMETAGFGGTCDLRFAVPPKAACMIDGEGTHLRDITLIDGAVPLEFSANEAFRVQVEWES
jgi:hypothetical protein